jgi:SAM-dependent methyltransferase
MCNSPELWIVAAAFYFVGTPWIPCCGALMSDAQTNVIDLINLRTMNSASAVQQYANDHGLFPSERTALDSVRASARGKTILDIGVGGGRTVRPLLEVSGDYLGIDYSPEMVKACRQLHPDVKLELMDARRLDGIADASIFLAMCGCAGVGMVSHEDRLLILREVFRVLQPGGVFLFSAYNQESPQHTAGFRFPSLNMSRNLIFLPLSMLGFVKHTAISLFNHARFRRLEVRHADYSLINDIWHDFGTMEYYISAANQRRQLASVGFEPDAVAFDDDARPIGSASTSHCLFFIARKPV